MSSKSPEIRFNGFTDDWEQSKLEDGVAKVGDGLHGTPSYNENGTVSFINGNNLVNGKIILTDQTKRVTEEQQSEHDKSLNENTILMSINGTIGNLAWYEGQKLMLGKSAAYIEVDTYNKKFMYQLLQTGKIKNYFLDNLTGTTIKNLGLKTIRQTPCLIPIDNEQSKIGLFLEKLDNTTALHQRELDNLRKNKKGFLQKMFPKRGEMIPKLRFSEYSNEWNIVKLGKIGITYSGLSGKTKEDFGHGEAEFVTYKNVFSNAITNINETENVEIDEKQNRVQYGDVFFTTSSETPEEVGMSSVWLENKDNTYLNSFCFGFRPTDNVNYLYLAYLLRSSEVRKQFIILAQGISRYNISKKKAMDITLMIPNLEEQEKIGTFFKQLDDKIGNKQQQLESLKQTKKAFLQKMFV